MEFNLSDSDDQDKDMDLELQKDPSDADEDGYYHAPVKPTPTVIDVPKKKQVHISPFLFVIPVIIVVIVVLRFLPISSTKSLNTLVRQPQKQIETELGLSLNQNPGFVTMLSVPNNNADGFETYTTDQEDFSVIYYEGKQFGISFSSRKYSLFGVKIDDAEYKILKDAEGASGTIQENGSPAYSYSNSFTMVEDMGNGKSTATYLLGTDGSVLVLVFNDVTNRLVNVIYYYDSERILQDITLF